MPTDSAASLLQNIANQAGSLAQKNAVGPGQVTAPQAAQLKQMGTASKSLWQQFYDQAGLNSASAKIPEMVNNDMLATQATWSNFDLKGGFAALNLSSQDAFDVAKYQQEQNQINTQELMSAAAIVAEMIIMF